MLHEYQTHNELNPQLWTSDQTMSDNVRYGFLKIANAFYEFLASGFGLGFLPSLEPILSDLMLFT